jgi:glutathione S-transferase
MKLYYHPVSSYSQKTVMAFHEKGVTFEPKIVSLMDPQQKAEYRKVHPLAKLPLLVDEKAGRTIPESSIIIEYIDRHCPGGTKLIPDDPDLARQVRFKDRMMDLYVNDSMSKILFDGMRPEGKHDTIGVDDAKGRLDALFAVMDRDLEGKTWAMGDTFSMADCAAAPALAYCRMVHPFDAHKNLSAYASRLFERPSFAKVHKEAEPFLAAFGSSSKPQ